MDQVTLYQNGIAERNQQLGIMYHDYFRAHEASNQLEKDTTGMIS